MGHWVASLAGAHSGPGDGIAFKATVRNGSACRLLYSADRLIAVSEHSQLGISKARYLGVSA